LVPARKLASSFSTSHRPIHSGEVHGRSARGLQGPIVFSQRDYALSVRLPQSERERLDTLVFPGWTGAAIGAKAGYPSIIVPAGYTAEGAAVGLTFLGRAGSEPALIRLAYAFERATRHRHPPASVA